MALTWHESEKLFLDFDSNKYPMFRISGSAEKGGKDRLLPMAPEFANRRFTYRPASRYFGF